MRTPIVTAIALVAIFGSGITVALPTSVCKGFGEFWQLPGIPGEFICKAHGCSQDCDSHAFAIEGGGYSIRCSCKDEGAGDGCCSLVLVLEPGEDPFLATIGDCGESCDVGTECVLWDVNEDGMLFEAACI